MIKSAIYYTVFIIVKFNFINVNIIVLYFRLNRILKKKVYANDHLDIKTNAKKKINF